MLKRFGTLFVGQVEHEDLGFDATPVNDRWYDDAHLASPMQSTEDLAILMDNAGYDTLWLAEHHFQREGYECIPNTLMMATHLAGKTERLRFGCGFNVLPTWHPVRLAEDYAMADILTKGRIRLGVGRGYHPREVDVLRTPAASTDDARELFEEQVELLMKALREPSFAHHGRFYDLPPKIDYRGYELEDLTLVPKPQHNHECWQPIVSASDRALEFMLDMGISGFVGGGAASGGASEAVARQWQEKRAARGDETELGDGLIFGFSFFLADSEAEAKVAGQPILEEYQKMFAPLGFAGDVTDQQLTQIGTRGQGAAAGLPTIDEAVASGAWLVGPAERLIDTFGQLQETYPGLEEIMVAQPVGAQPSVVMEQMQRFAEEVLPHFG